MALLRCVCPGGTKGPRCKVLTRTFTGKGWLWLDPLPPCSPTTISLRLLTTSPDVHLLYSGPLDTLPSIPLSLAELRTFPIPSEDPVTPWLGLSRPRNASDTPFLVPPQLMLRLVAGRPRLDVKGPGGSVTLQFDATLNDGVWHSLHLRLDKQVGSTMLLMC